MADAKGFMMDSKFSLIATGVVVIIGFGMWAALRNSEPKTVTNFSECAAASGVVQESYPRRCIYNGQTFTEVIANINSVLNTNAYSTVNINVDANLNTNTNIDTQSDAEETIDLKTTLVSSADEWAIYSNQEIDISFSYPKKWGEPKIDFEDLEQNGEGKSMQVDFPAMRATSFGGLLHLQYSTIDFGPGREVWYGEIFSRLTTRQSFASICSWSADDFSLSPIDKCSVASTGGHTTATFISRIDALGGEEVLDFVKTFAFTTGNSEYPSATLSLFLPELTRSRVSTSDAENLTAIVNNIDTKNLDEISNNHLGVFEKILESFTFID